MIMNTSLASPSKKISAGASVLMVLVEELSRKSFTFGIKYEIRHKPSPG